MVRKWVPAHPSVKDARGVRVLFDRAKVEHPEVLAMVVLEKLLCVFSAIAIEALEANRWVSHYHHMVRDICEVFIEYGP